MYFGALAPPRLPPLVKGGMYYRTTNETDMIVAKQNAEWTWRSARFQVDDVVGDHVFAAVGKNRWNAIYPIQFYLLKKVLQHVATCPYYVLPLLRSMNLKPEPVARRIISLLLWFGVFWISTPMTLDTTRVRINKALQITMPKCDTSIYGLCEISLVCSTVLHLPWFIHSFIHAIGRGAP